MENENDQTINHQPSTNGLDAVKAQLEEEKTAKTALEGTLAEKDARIGELETSLSEAKELSEAKAKDLEASAAELASTREAKDQAVAKYLNVAKALNPTVPQDIIAGATIGEIDASIDKGKAIVEAVKKAMEAEAAQAKVPAGAPTRGGITTEGMSPREKIAAGISRQSRET